LRERVRGKSLANQGILFSSQFQSSIQVRGVELYFSYYSYMYVILIDLCQEIQIMYDGD